MEQPVFFKNNDYNLFGILHHPISGKIEQERQSNSSIGIIFCSAFAEEKLWSQRVFVNFARELALRGYYSLRFDYMGHGDSDGTFEDSTVETRLSDINRAIEFLLERTEVKHVGLLGLRLGATFAFLATERRADIDFLMLWSPIIIVNDYLQMCMRSNLATQMSIFRKIIYTREKMINALEVGKSINIDGYLISSKFYQQASKINLIDGLPQFSNPILISHIVKNPDAKIPTPTTNIFEKIKKRNEQSTLSVVKEEPFWSELRVYYQKAENLFNSTLDWLNKLNIN